MVDALAARLAVAGFTLAALVIAAREIGPAEFGVYATATAFSTFILLLTDLGSGGTVVREATQSDARGDVLKAYLQVRLAIVVALAGVGALVAQVAFPPEVQSVATLASVLVLFSGPAIILPIGQVVGDLRPVLRASVVQGALTLIATLVALYAVPDPSSMELVGAQLVGAISGSAIAAESARKWLSVDPFNVDWPLVRALATGIGLIGIGSALAISYARIDSILLINLAGAKEAGIYSAAYKLLDQTQILATVLLVPIAPLLAETMKGTNHVPGRIDSPLRRIEVLGGLGLLVATVVIGTLSVPILLGEDFSSSGTILAILGTYRAVSVVAYFATSKLINAKAERAYIAIATTGLVVNVVANILVIPEYGAEGAAVVTVATELTVTLLAAVVARKYSSKGRAFALLALVCVAAATCGLTLLTIEHASTLRLFGLGLLGVTSAGALLALTVHTVRTQLPQQSTRSAT